MGVLRELRNMKTPPLLIILIPFIPRECLLWEGKGGLEGLTIMSVGPSYLEGMIV